MHGRVNPKSVLGQGLMNARPEMIEQLKEHEREVDAETGDVNLDLLETVRKLSEENERIKREDAKLKADLAAATNKLQSAEGKLTYEQLKRRSVRHTIGVTGIHPAVLDVRIETTKMNGRETQIAWVPVPVWQVPIQNEQRPWFTWKDREGKEQKRPNLDIGSVRIAESLATVFVVDLQGKKHEVSITGFCTLNMASKSPAEIARRLDRAERKQNWEEVSHPDESPDGTENEAHGEGEMSFEKPGFTVAGQVTPTQKQEGRTDKSGSPNDEEVS